MTAKCEACLGTGKPVNQVKMGKEMRAKRIKANLTLAEVAQRMHCAVAYLCDLELGRRHWRTSLVSRFDQAISRAGRTNTDTTENH